MRFLRKAVTLAASLTLALSLLGSAAGVASANEGNCESAGKDQAGMENLAPAGSSRSAVQGVLAISNTQFDMCNNPPLGSIKGPSAWVSIVPQVAVPCYGSCANNIMQIGIIECSEPVRPGSGCYGEDHPHYFWAWGGCGLLNIPINQDLGPADYNNHIFRLYLDWDNYWHFGIDNVEKASIPDTWVSCWTSYLRKAQWVGERNDGGDSTGGSSDVTLMSSAKYGIFAQGWFSTSWNSSSGCTGATTESKCDIVSSTAFHLWTVQQ